MTPEFPGGTYAYFVTIDAAAYPVFPCMFGKQYYGTKTGAAMNVTVPAAGVTERFNGFGLNSPEVVAAPGVDAVSGDVTRARSSVEGGTYQVQASNDQQSWTTLNSALPATANTTLPTPEDVVTQTSVIETGAALFPAQKKRFYRIKRN